MSRSPARLDVTSPFSAAAIVALVAFVADERGLESQSSEQVTPGRRVPHARAQLIRACMLIDSYAKRAKESYVPRMASGPKAWGRNDVCDEVRGGEA